MLSDDFLGPVQTDDGRTATEQTDGRTDEQANVQESNSVVQSPYSAVQLAEWCGVSEATIRNRWFSWLTKVAPEPLLREGRGYSELARQLFLEFKNIPQNKRNEWVADAKDRYSQEWSSAGIIDGELVPDGVGGMLATLQQGNQDLAGLMAQEMERAIALSNQLESAESDLSAAEIEAFKIAGTRRGIARYTIEKQAEAAAYSQLRQNPGA